MTKKEPKTVVDTTFQTDINSLYTRITKIIEKRKTRIYTKTNQEVTMMFWEIGKYINTVILDDKRAAYGKKVLTELAIKLTEKYGRSFTERNLYRMTLFAERFSDTKILPPVAAKLSWSHIIELLPLKTDETRMFYANDAAARNYGAKELRRQISRKAYERREIANSNLTEKSIVPFNVFKDPYLLDILGLKENFLEADLEKAILIELEKFILEFGHGFTFVERQKRMIMDGDDFVLDLLFYHRDLKRLIAVELKIGKFVPQYEGQMKFYLKWLNRYERREGENEPIGLILCTKASRNQIELMELDKSGIAVAEYWTELPPKNLLEEKIQAIVSEAEERLERRKLLSGKKNQKHIDYFYESKDDDLE